MTITTWADALKSRTVDDLRADILAKAVAKGVTVNGWEDSAPQRALVEADASALAYETQLRAQLAAIASPTTATSAGGDWVDAAVGWFDLDNGTGGKGRIQASKASWTVPLIVTAAGSPVTVDNTSTIQLQAVDGTIFVANQATPVTLNVGSSYKGTATFTARLVGTTGNVAPGAITKVISGPAGLSVDLTGTQVLTVAARDIETDVAVIKRALGKWGTLGAGWTLTSFDYLIPLYAPTVTGWKVRDDNPDGPGSIRVIMRNAAGPSLTGENAAVLAGLSSTSVRPIGSGPIKVVSASALSVAVTGTLYSDGTNGSLLANAVSALSTLQQAFPIGGDADGMLRRVVLEAILMGGALATYGVPGYAGAKNLVLSAPAADTPFASDSVVAFNTAGLVVG